MQRDGGGFLRKLIINVIAEPGSIDNGQCDANTILVEFCGKT